MPRVEGVLDDGAGRGTTKPTTAETTEPEGALFWDQGTPSETELMDFWAVTCWGSGSNWESVLLSKDVVQRPSRVVSWREFQSTRLA